MTSYWNMILIIVGTLGVFLSTNIFGHVEWFSIIGVIFIFVGLYRMITK